MLNSFIGPVSRRYVAILVLICVGLTLWHGFSSTAINTTPLGSGSGLSSSLSSSSSPNTHPSSDDIKFVASTFDWSESPTYFPVSEIKTPPVGKPKQFPAVQAAQSAAATQDDITEKRKRTIQAKFSKSWEAYKLHAWTKDELMPLSGKGKTSLSDWGAQLVDALDTLWIMGMKDDFHLALKEVAAIDWAKTTGNVNIFEVTIRYLGGLISAYELSQEQVLLAKAMELGDTLYAGFDTPNRLPPLWLDYLAAKSGEQLANTQMSAANGGSLGLELTRLSQLTGNPKYYDAAERVKQFFYKFQDQTRVPGLWPVTINYQKELMEHWKFTLGAGADSLYEYLPKMDMLLGGLDPEYEEMAIKALEAARDNLLFKPMTSTNENILVAGTLVRQKENSELVAEMQHLTCFAGGMYAMAGRLYARDEFVDIGSLLTAGCVWAYDSFETNIMPEVSHLVACASMTGPCPNTNGALPSGRETELPDGFVKVHDTTYRLRPEAIESVFYMWRITGDQVWRDAAWRMWEGIVAHTETETAFASIADVTTAATSKVDTMEVSDMRR